MNPAELPKSPYKGLVPYTEEDSAFFFGRDREIEIIADNLMASRLTLLYGASGVGKSSVLRAGVAHRLAESALRSLREVGTPEGVVVVFSSWRDDIFPALGRRIRESAAKIMGDRLVGGPRDESGFVGLLNAWTEHLNADLLLVFDQFEEYFLYHGGEGGEGTFAVEFPRAVNTGGLRANFLISMREEALSRLDRFKGRIPRLFNNYFRISHLGDEGGRSAVIKPVDYYNTLVEGPERVKIEPELVTDVLDQVSRGRVLIGGGGRGMPGIAEGTEGERAIETPYLQLVLTRLWNEEMAEGSRVLRRTTLNERLGSAEKIVQTHLDTAMDQLTDAGREGASKVFHFLVTPGGTKIAHTVSDLSALAGVDEGELVSLLDRLAGPDLRILRPVDPPPGKPDSPRFEIFHDVLAQAVLDWRRRYLGKQAEETLRREQQARLEEERAAYERQRQVERARRMRVSLVVLGGLLAVVLVLLVVAVRGRNDALRAKEQAVRAQQDADTARAEALKAKSLAEELLMNIIAIEDTLSPATIRMVKDLAESGAPMVNKEIAFKVTYRDLGYRNPQDQPVFRFRIYPDPATIAGGLGKISSITYKFEHSTFKVKTLETEKETGFAASYIGWGCLDTVVAVIRYADPGHPSAIAVIRMCESMEEE